MYSPVTNKETLVFYLTKLEPAFLSAIITSCLYFFGYGYLSSYYGNLSISLKLIDFQLSDYLLAGLIPTFIVLGIIIVSILSWKGKPQKNTSKKFKPFNIISNCVFILQFMLIYSFLVSVFEIWSHFILFVFILFGILMLFKLKNRGPEDKYKSIPYELYNEEIYYKGLLIVILIITAFSVAYISGNIVAEDTIQGKNSHSKDVKLILKDKNVSDEIENKSLILIVIDDNKFYFIEKNETLRKYPKLYIIPGDQIKTVILKQNNS